MLYLEAPVTFNDVTFYRDFSDEKLFYYLPKDVLIGKDAEALHFSIFTDKTIREEELANLDVRQIGGFINLESVLGPNSDELKDAIDALKGYAGDDVKITPVPFETGKVNLAIFGKNSESKEKDVMEIEIVCAGKPCLTGNHQSAFNMRLGGNAAQIVYDLLTNTPQTQMAVYYEMDFMGVTPAYNVEIEVDFHATEKYINNNIDLDFDLENKDKNLKILVDADIDSVIQDLVNEGAIVIKETDYTEGHRFNEGITNKVELIKTLLGTELFNPTIMPNSPNAVLKDTINLAGDDKKEGKDGNATGNGQTNGGGKDGKSGNATDGNQAKPAGGEQTKPTGTTDKSNQTEKPDKDNGGKTTRPIAENNVEAKVVKDKSSTESEEPKGPTCECPPPPSCECPETDNSTNPVEDPEKNPSQNPPKKSTNKQTSKNTPKDKDPKGNDPKGDDPKGDDPKGDDPKGDDPKGDDPKGDDPKGDDPKGNDPKGNDPKNKDEQKKSGFEITAKLAYTMRHRELSDQVKRTFNFNRHEVKRLPFAISGILSTSNSKFDPTKQVHITNLGVGEFHETKISFSPSVSFADFGITKAKVDWRMEDMKEWYSILLDKENETMKRTLIHNDEQYPNLIYKASFATNDFGVVNTEEISTTERDILVALDKLESKQFVKVRTGNIKDASNIVVRVMPDGNEEKQQSCCLASDKPILPLMIDKCESYDVVIEYPQANGQPQRVTYRQQKGTNFLVYPSNTVRVILDETAFADDTVKQIRVKITYNDGPSKMLVFTPSKMEATFVFDYEANTIQNSVIKTEYQKIHADRTIEDNGSEEYPGDTTEIYPIIF